LLTERIGGNIDASFYLDKIGFRAAGEPKECAATIIPKNGGYQYFPINLIGGETSASSWSVSAGTTVFTTVEIDKYFGGGSEIGYPGHCEEMP